MEPLLAQPYHTERGDKAPRYYQQIAINRTFAAFVACRHSATPCGRSWSKPRRRGSGCWKRP